MLETICTATKSNPSLTFDNEKNIFKIEGICTLVNAIEFFESITEWINLNEHRLQKGAEFQFHLPYFNSASMKGIMFVMQRIKKGMDAGQNWTIGWHVEEDDEFLLDAAESFQDMINVEIEILRP
ncbi:MAG: SiaC family regulatory phosphoprotein [Flavobacteriales bacterium]